MQTRSMRRRKIQLYRSRVKASPCRGQTTKCRRRNGCKKTMRGKRKSYCRKLKNTHA